VYDINETVKNPKVPDKCPFSFHFINGAKKIAAAAFPHLHRPSPSGDTNGMHNIFGHDQFCSIAVPSTATLSCS
jgi:hypothetical protein